ncbi:MAG: VanZ family protein [Planctomycetota bacterium]
MNTAFNDDETGQEPLLVRRLMPLALALYWLLIFTATHLPSDRLPELGTSDKLQHFVAYGILAFLLSHFLRARAKWQRANRLAIATILIVGFYAIFDENTQRLIPGRTYDVLDILADCIGGCLGYAAFYVLPKPSLPGQQ